MSEILVNAIIHRDYMDLGCEVHVDMYDDRLEVFSPGGIVDGSLIQQQDLLTITSRRRNPLLADFFSRLNLMERRGSGMRKILDAYTHFKNLPTYRAPEFHSNARDFRVVLWNLNYDENIPKEDGNILKGTRSILIENKSILKESLNDLKARREFLQAQRIIYKLISKDSHVTIKEMAEQMGIAERNVRRHLKRLTGLKLIAREGGRKMGEWRIIDEDYETFFERI